MWQYPIFGIQKAAPDGAAFQTVKKPCHSEEVAHTGVGIPRILQHFRPKIEDFYLYLGDCHTSDIGHWFAMTLL